MDINEVAKLLGKKGGQKTVEMYGKKHFIEAQKKSVASRLKNKAKKKAVDK